MYSSIVGVMSLILGMFVTIYTQFVTIYSEISAPALTKLCVELKTLCRCFTLHLVMNDCQMNGCQNDLEAISLLVVAPTCRFAACLPLRRHRLPFLARYYLV